MQPTIDLLTICLLTYYSILHCIIVLEGARMQYSMAYRNALIDTHHVIVTYVTVFSDCRLPQHVRITKRNLAFKVIGSRRFIPSIWCAISLKNLKSSRARDQRPQLSITNLFLNCARANHVLMFKYKFQTVQSTC